MKVISTSQILTRLSKSFNGVSALVKIDSSLPEKYGTMVSGHIPFEGLTLICGCYPLGELSEDCDYQRFLYIPETDDTFHF